MSRMMRAILWSIALLSSAAAFGNELSPSEQEVLKIYNAAQTAQSAGKHEEALKGFLTVKKYYPDDWRTRAKIIQEYSALGKLNERDAEITALHAFRSELSKESQSELSLFVREQFIAGKRKLMALEYFALQGDRAIKYSFVVLDKTGKRQEFKITLGSYDTTTQVARETGSIGENERLFHLDGYFAGGEHRTYGFFKGEPKYDDIRKMVVEILEGKVRHVSGTKPTEEGTEVELKIDTEERTAPTKPSTSTE
ncbi:MAG: hypothetical protein PVI97_19655 [Candidatus Thiodiazotropha sp.]|jgi:hypothetical protein